MSTALKSWRKVQNFSLRQAAKAIGVSHDALRLYETGERRPTYPSAKAIFIATGGEVTPNDFYPIADWRAELDEANSSTLSAIEADPVTEGAGGIGQSSAPSTDPANHIEAAE